MTSVTQEPRSSAHGMVREMRAVLATMAKARGRFRDGRRAFSSWLCRKFGSRVGLHELPGDALAVHSHVLKMVLAQLVAALALRPTAVPTRRSGVSMMADASTLELKAQILQVAALTDRGQRLNTLSAWHASNTGPTYLPS